MRASIGITAFAVLLAVPLAAQEHDMAGQGRMHKMMEEMMAPMMRGMAFEPEQLLRRKDVLGLSTQQVARLTALRDAAKTAHDAAHGDAKTHMDALATAMHPAAPDTGAVKLHFQGMHAACAKAHLTMLTAAAQAKAVLTDDQRGRVQSHEH